MKTKEKKPKVVRRRMVGVKVLAGWKCPPHVYALYEVDYSDFTTKLERGDSVHASENTNMLNGTKKQRKWAEQEYRPDLYTNMQAAFVLLQQLEAACGKLDSERGKPEM